MWVANSGYQPRTLVRGASLADIDQHTTTKARRVASLTPSRHSASGRRAMRGLLPVAGLATATVFACAALVVNALVSRLVEGDRVGLLAAALVAVVSTVGACAATWSARPAIMRMVSRAAGGLGGR